MALDTVKTCLPIFKKLCFQFQNKFAIYCRDWYDFACKWLQANFCFGISRFYLCYGELKEDIHNQFEYGP